MPNNLWTAFIADNGSNDVLVASLPEGGTWTGGAPIYQTSPFTPSLAYFNDSLYVAFITDDENSATGVPSNRIFLCSTTDGVTWNAATFFKQYSKCAPSLAVFNNRLYVAFVANNSGNAVCVCSSPDGTTWTGDTDINQSSKFAPSLAVFNNDLYVAFVANNSGNAVCVCSSADGTTWTGDTDINQSSKFAPSLAVFNNDLYVAFVANNSGNAVCVCSSTDGTAWTNDTDINQSSKFAPSLAVFNNELYVSFIANNSSGEVLVSSNSDPTTSWTGGNVDLKQQSAAGSAIAVAPIAYDPVLPGPTAARINYLITNYNIDDPLQNITVTVVADQDLVNTETFNAVGYKPVGSPITTGFSFQLNCQPPGTIPNTGPAPTGGENVWGQYGIGVQGTQFSMWYENSFADGLGPVYRKNCFTLPKANTIPQGYKVEMKLVSDPSTNSVTELSVNVWDNNGNPVDGGPWSLPVTNQPAPMLNLQFNIGGLDGGEYSIFQSGSQSFPLGTVFYEADSPLMVRGATNAETAENSNVSFALLAADPTNPIVQYFSAP